MKKLTLITAILVLLFSCKKEVITEPAPTTSISPTNQMIQDWSGQYVGTYSYRETNIDPGREVDIDTMYSDTFTLSATANQEWTLQSSKTGEQYEAIPVDPNETEYQEVQNVSASMHLRLLGQQDSIYYGRTWSQTNLHPNGWRRSFIGKRL